MATLTVLILLGCRDTPASKTTPAEAPAPTSTQTTQPVPTLPTSSGGVRVETASATSLGTSAFGANGRIWPTGAPTECHFEYGLTSSYGSVTPTRSLGPKLAAHYTESWDAGLGGWRGGSGFDLVSEAAGGVSGGYARYQEPTGTDYNHMDGIGPLHLSQYFYPGIFSLDYPTASLGGGDPDFRDARVQLWVRGVDWGEQIWWLDPELDPPFARGDELVFWAQADATVADDLTHISNWAHTGSYLTDALFSGDWTAIDYRLYADTRDWSYAGQDRSQGRDVYVYHPIDEVLHHLDVDFFHLLLFVDDYIELNSAIDFDEIDITYRNHSLLYPSNGGTLATSPPGSSDDVAALTDGYRFGDGHTWHSGPDPSGPLEFVFDLASEVNVERVLIHNDPDWPSRTVEVEASLDGLVWTPLASGELPTGSEHGPNFDHLLVTGLDTPARHVLLRVTSGYQPDAWGLGEIEIFGTGALMETDDDWYSVAEDVTGLEPGQTYHFRLVAMSGGETVAGIDQTFTVPTGEIPEVATGGATLIGERRVRLAGVVNTLGTEGWYTFELGLDPVSYDHRSTP